MIRIPGWEARLERFFEANRLRRFKYGTWDCGLFAAGAIETMTGTDLAVAFRGRYESRKTARERMVEYSGRSSIASVAAAVARSAALLSVAPVSAFRGDLAVVRRSVKLDSFGIVDLSGRNVAILGRNGIVAVPLDLAVSTWRV